MIQYLFTFTGARGGAMKSLPLYSDSLRGAVDDALSMLLSEPGAWAFEIRNLAGFVLRIVLKP